MMNTNPSASMSYFPCHLLFRLDALNDESRPGVILWTPTPCAQLPTGCPNIDTAWHASSAKWALTSLSTSPSYMQSRLSQDQFHSTTAVPRILVSQYSPESIKKGPWLSSKLSQTMNCTLPSLSDQTESLCTHKTHMLKSYSLMWWFQKWHIWEESGFWDGSSH